MKRLLTATALTLALLGSAHATDNTVYVRMIVGVEVCKLDQDPAIRESVVITRAILAKRVLNNEITSDQIAAAKKKALRRQRGELCKQTANMYRIIMGN